MSADLAGIVAGQRLACAEPAAPADVLTAVAGINVQGPDCLPAALVLRGGRVEELAEALASGRIVKANLMRGTVHAVTAEQYRGWRPALQPRLRAIVRSEFRAVSGIDPDELIGRGIELLDGNAAGLSRGDLGKSLAEHFRGVDAAGLGFAARMMLPVVEVPAACIWHSTRTRYRLVDGWDQPASDGLAVLWESFFTAFPGSEAEDFRYWSGLGAADVAALELPSAASREVSEVAEVPRPVVLAPWDNLWYCCAKRRADAGLNAHKGKHGLDPGRMPGVLLTDGVPVAAWKITKRAVTILWGDPDPWPEPLVRVQDALTATCTCTR